MVKEVQKLSTINVQWRKWGLEEETSGLPEGTSRTDQETNVLQLSRGNRKQLRESISTEERPLADAWGI